MTQSQQIPAGWNKKTLPEIAKIRKGLTYKSEDYGNEKDGLVFVTLKCISKGGGFNKDGIKYYKGKFEQSNTVKTGDLIIANTDLTRAGDIIGAPLFMPHISETPVLISMDLSAIDINQETIIKQYLYYYLLQDHVRQFMRSISSGSTVLHLQLKSLTSLSIFLPPITEQTKIAVILSKVDEEIEKVEKIIERIEKFKRGLIKSLLTKGIGHTKFKNTELGDIPEEWDVVTLKNSDIDIIDGDRGENYPKKNEFMDKGYCLFLSNKNIKNDKFIFDECAFITEEKDKLLRKGKLKRLDIVLTTRGTVGNVAYFDEKIPFENIRLNSGMLIFRAGESFHPGFLYALFKSPLMKNKYMTVASGSAQPQLPIKSLEQIKIPIPPKDEQKNIATILESIDQLLYKTKKQRKTVNRLKRGLMSDLLSGKVRVKI